MALKSAAAREKARLYRARWEAANKQRIAARRKAKHAEDPDKWHAQMRKTEQNYKERNPDMFWLKTRNRHYRRSYGISFDKAIEILELQGNCCCICKTTLSLFSHNAHVDHCHLSNKVRGILCRTCNMQIGWFEKWPDFYIHARFYLGVGDVE
jgi:hypothetical protein